MELSLSRYFSALGIEGNVAPTLTVKEEPLLSAVGPFSRVKGTIMRSGALIPERYGDAIWSGKKVICVIDASSPRRELLSLGEADMVKDLRSGLSTVFDGTPLNPLRLLDALNEVLTSNGRDSWRGDEGAEFGLSMGGIYYADQLITVFNIGTGALYINGKMKIAPRKEFHNPYPVPGSKVVKAIIPTVLRLPQEGVNSVIICTDGVDLKRYSPTSNSPIPIAPDAKEATILKLSL